MLDWDDLRTFLMIARHRTLSGAARALGVQQPTMGRRLEALEQRAGATLLQKTPTGYVLTEAGEAVLGNVERIEAETQAVERLIAGKDSRLEGTVRLTTLETLAAEILSPVLAAFRLSHPALRVEIVAATRSLSLTRREADVALRLAPFTQSDIVARKVGAVAFGLYASAVYLEQFGSPDWERGAEGHALIVTEADLLDTPEMRWLRGLAPAMPVALASNSRLVHRAAAREGIGIACLARYLGDSEPGLIRIPAPSGAAPSPVRDLWLGVHSDMRHTPRIRAFTTALQDGLKHAAGRLQPVT
ncbi:MAG: LysR family transcriptional regulator [Rhodopila sp.]|nr:LysR family transcriptional regulator [Rhodopila sp.]